MHISINMISSPDLNVFDILDNSATKKIIVKQKHQLLISYHLRRRFIATIYLYYARQATTLSSIMVITNNNTRNTRYTNKASVRLAGTLLTHLIARAFIM